MMEQAQRVAGWLMNQVRVNHVRPCTRDGVPVFVKRRRAGASVVIWFANQLLELADSGVCMFVRADEWTDWEAHCARLLYPEGPGVTVEPGRAVVIPQMRGVSLRALLQRDDSDVEKAFALAARELRRVHRLPCSGYQAAWSHGDLHLDNILYDPTAERAVLIDFDMRHVFGISPARRQADDLQIVLLELIGRPDDRWQRLATAFIEGYREDAVLSELSRRLVVPRGFGRLLWYIRTNGAPMHRIEPRLQSLRAIVDRVRTGT
jgi:hypothetical protein